MKITASKLKDMFQFVFRHFWKFVGLVAILGCLYIARSGYSVKFGNLQCEKGQTADIHK